jgi:ApbE superfamily uncharacterized protein (UPF0280 family)
MKLKRRYKTFTHKEAVFRICCEAYDAVTAEIIAQRQILEEYIAHHPEFQRSLSPIEVHSHAPDVAKQMAAAAKPVGVGPMAAVAGTMAEFAGRAGIAAGAHEVIVENGGDIWLQTTEEVTIGLVSGEGDITNQLAFSIQPEDTPIAICSSSGLMGHSMSLGQCDLATVVAKDTALADAAATQAANLVKTQEDVEITLNEIASIEGIDGVLIVKDGQVGLAGKLPPLVRIR